MHQATDVGPILKDFSRLKISTSEKMKKFFLKSNTDLCMDVKTILHSDSISKIGKDYQGVLTRDEETHYVFIETIPPAAEKRNPQIFRGEFITITRRDDGSYRPNFRPIPRGEGFSLERYALGVYNEICMALGGLVEEE